MRHFDVQLIGGMALHQGKIAEMRTGEGKTLMATLPVYLNALAGKGRACGDRQRLPRRCATPTGWGGFTASSGMSVGTILSSGQCIENCRYAADITYGTNNEYGFDYLRDNMECGGGPPSARTQLRHR